MAETLGKSLINNNLHYGNVYRYRVKIKLIMKKSGIPWEWYAASVGLYFDRSIYL